MRIHRLEIEGFGPFRDRQVVDVDALARDGLFLIAGKTGAGKSSILDAVCFALYGSVPRYDDGDRRLRSDHAEVGEPTRVVMEFSAGAERWQVERSPSYERPKKSGTGTTMQAARARLAQWRDGDWQDVAARAVDVGTRLGEVLALSKDQFLQVILLAQGRFQEFLHAHNDERQKLLRTLFGSHRFQRYEQELDERRKRAEQELGAARRGVELQLAAAEKRAQAGGYAADSEAQEEQNPVGASTAERLTRLAAAVREAAARSERAVAEEADARTARDDAEAALAPLIAVREAQQRRTQARSRAAALEARAEEVAAERGALARAQQAEALRGVLDAAEAAVVRHAEANERERDARAQWQDAGEDAAAPPETRIDALVALTGELAAAARDEEVLGTAQRQAAEAASAASILEERTQELAQSRAALPARISACGEALAAATVRAAARDDARTRTAEAIARQEAAARAERSAIAFAEAEQAAAAAGREMTAASAHLDELRERRFRDHAGELAEHLVDGEPCLVCGSLQHPAPAVRRDEAVSAEDIARAQVQKDAAVRADRAAADAERAARTALADDRERAGGADAASAAREVDAARAAEEAAGAAAAEVDTLTAERAALQGRLAEAEEQAAQLATELSAARSRQQAAEQSARDLEKRVRAARGTFDTVAERRAEIEQRIAIGRAWADARREVATRERESAEAQQSRDERVAESPFAELAAVRAALRPEAERARMDESVRAYDAERVATERALTELADIPEEEVDTAGAAQTRDLARARWERALQASAAAGTDSTALAADVAAAQAAAEAGAEAEEAIATLELLAAAVAGRADNTRKMDVETFVLAAELERIVAAANVRLEEMSDGRYLLEHSDRLAAHGRASGLGITVMDRNTGRSRPVQSLSGGETFLASLALALGLAQVVTSDAGGVTLDTLFIDEGFGALDAETLEVAMRTLDELRADGRVVGVISHVEAMQATLPAGVTVEATGEGPSIIHQAL